MHPDGSAPERATSSGLDIDFAWAPDGTRFAYVSQRGALDELWVAAWDGSGATRIFQGSPIRSPDWSPDGTRLVFLASVDLGPQDDGGSTPTARGV
jgi:Tol biopolymer transport system component